MILPQCGMQIGYTSISECDSNEYHGCVHGRGHLMAHTPSVEREVCDELFHSIRDQVEVVEHTYSWKLFL